MTYDNSANLTALQRYRDTGTLVDNLTYTIAASSNRLTTLADAVGATTETWDAEAGSFTYDANGNQLTAPAPYSLTASTYDYQNLPLSFTRSGTTTAYRYNEVGQRIAKQVGAGNTEVYLLEDRVPLGVYTVNGAGTVVSSYVNLLADTRVVGRQPNAGSRSYYHTDLLGSTRAVVQGATVTESYDYDPWGVLLPGRTLGSGTKEQFTTKERDAETGLDYFGARLNASAIGRWTTVDPAVAADQHPEWSPYNFVLNDPPAVVDPDGRQVSAQALQGAVALAGTGTALEAVPGVGQVVGTVLVVAGAGLALYESAKALGTFLSDLAGAYRPPGPIPRTKEGHFIPDSDYPHTQLGTKTGRKVGDYTQGVEFGAGGRPVKRIDFTDHGRPNEHPNPHEHPINDTPATPGEVGKSRPLAPTEPARLTGEAKGEKPEKKVP